MLEELGCKKFKTVVTWNLIWHLIICFRILMQFGLDPFFSNENYECRAVNDPNSFPASLFSCLLAST
jgi:hypothetical protein